MADPAIGYRFLVTIDDRPLGVFTKVEGLGAKYEVLAIKEGGENSFVHALPGRLSFDNLKLTRPVDASSGKIAAWFSEFKPAMQTGGRLRHATASVAAYGTDDQVVAKWEFEGVHPVSYSGPSFQAGSASILTETLELAHHGFTFGEGDAPAAAAAKAQIGRRAPASVGAALGAGASF
jgi:phage tail-like protein